MFGFSNWHESVVDISFSLQKLHNLSSCLILLPYMFWLKISSIWLQALIVEMTCKFWLIQLNKFIFYLKVKGGI
jgi:hypothetical protein